MAQGQDFVLKKGATGKKILWKNCGAGKNENE